MANTLISRPVRKDVCIMLSTCDRYKVIAEWTANRIRKEWPGHPPVRFNGFGDQREWMSVTLGGVAAARHDGFRWIYLLLDDHPPVGPCHRQTLNETLPSIAEELDSVNICLLGWGQRRELDGVVMGRRAGWLRRNNASFRWKFSLHPALWNAEALQEILEARLHQYDEGARTPWNFERHRDASDSPVRRRLLENTYRIHGQSTAVGSRFLDEITRQPSLLAFDVFRFGLRILAGQQCRETFDRDNLWLYHYYRGPYPILWSGAVRQGLPSRDFENFIRFSGRCSLLREWREVKAKFIKPC